MTHFDQLLSVQDLDTHIDQLVHRRAHLSERTLIVEAGEMLRASQAQIAVQEELVGELTRAQRRVEDALASLEGRAVDIDRQLYGGTVSNARELQDLQTELESVKKRISTTEDAAFAGLEGIEPAEARLAELVDQHAAIEARRFEATQALTAAEAEIDVDLDEARAKRVTAVVGIPEAMLSNYEQIRYTHQGVGIARLVGNRCEGCHLTLASADVDRIKHLDPDDVALCEECGRMLVH